MESNESNKSNESNESNESDNLITELLYFVETERESERENKRLSELDNKNSTNTFVQYLLKKSDLSAINYLKFAKSCSPYSQVTYDPWGKGKDSKTKQRTKKIKLALKKCKAESNEMLKKRYAFLAIRLAYYAGNESQLNSIHATYFSSNKSDVIDYWASYFKLCYEPTSI